MSEIRMDITKIQQLVDPILSKLVNKETKKGLFDEIAIPLQHLATPLPGISDISGQDITFLVSFAHQFGFRIIFYTSDIQTS